MITNPKDAMPWVGLYVAGASLACTLAMATDAFQGFRQWKLWFPNKFFTLNSVSITLVAIAMKIPLDLTTNMSDNDEEWIGKIVSIIFLVTMLANFLPSLGLMDDKELLVNMVAWIPASRRILEHKYKELHGLASYPQEIKFSYEELEHNVKKYWMMAETGNPQFAIACSEVASASGFNKEVNISNSNVTSEMKEYAMYVLQIEDDAKLSEEISRNALKSINKLLSKSEKNEPGNLIKLIKKSTGFQGVLEFDNDKVPPLHSEETKNSWSLVVVTLIAIFVALPKKGCRPWFNKEVNISNSNLTSEMKEYAMYVLQIEDDAKLSEEISRNALKSINKLLSKSEKNEPGNLIKLIKKSTGFQGVLEFDNDKVPPLHSEETKNSWSLVVVTLIAIFVALPKKAGDHGEGLIASMREGLRIVRNIEECLNVDSDLVKTRKAARRVWTQVEVYHKWLQIDLQKKAHDGKTSKEILEWLRDEAVKIVIQFKSCKRRRIDDSHYMFIASSMYRVSQTILIHCSELENWPIDGKLMDWISDMIADILCACFTNVPRVIKMMCHHDAIEKREDSVRSAAQLFGRSRKILKILNSCQLPNIDVDSMAYISKWHALPKSEIPNGAPLDQIPSPNESVIVNMACNI
ncbi:hypothetical protein CTI12_AA575050 [Artemisia annua]|uniref:Uncharacterized protein n=1 Tax=Artemisia annua TaxID=35608 RepID=A0A2U1KR17_ARTAN|nr:hypothetical protein CTI12_AA575050 [Artemisia annua]